MSGRSSYLRFLIWCSVILVLIAAWLYVWTKKTEPITKKTAFIIAQRQIISNANNYKQYWLLNKNVLNINIDGIYVNFTANGWPIVLHEGNINCNKWLYLLWPDKKIFGQSYTVSNMFELENTVTCEYKFTKGGTLYLQLINDGFYVEFKI